MSFVLGSVLFLLGGFLGMLLMAFANSIPKQIREEQDRLVAQLRLVVNND